MFSLHNLLRLSLVLSSLVPACVAQSSSSSTTSGSSRTVTASTSSTSTSSTAKIHKVAVGAGGFSYDPNTTYADPGDIVVFEFFPTNHSVIRAEYTEAKICPKGGCNPCVPYELIHPDASGFHSPNVLTQNVIADQAITWNLTIHDTEPMFFYCNAIESCHPNGMVGVINPNETVSLEKQHDAAISAPYQLGPGQAFPAEGSGSGGNGAGMNSSSTSGATTGTATPASESGHHNHLSGGAIAGIVIGAVVVALLAAALFYFAGRTKALTDLLIHKKPSPEGGQQGTSPAPDIGPWSPMPMAQNENRFSGMTAYSTHAPPQGGVMYAEAPMGAEYKAAYASPPIGQGAFSNAHHSVELPGDQPTVSEAPTRKG